MKHKYEIPVPVAAPAGSVQICYRYDVQSRGNLSQDDSGGATSHRAELGKNRPVHEAIPLWDKLLEHSSLGEF